MLGLTGAKMMGITETRQTPGDVHTMPAAPLPTVQRSGGCCCRSANQTPLIAPQSHSPLSCPPSRPALRRKPWPAGHGAQLTAGGSTD